MQIGYSSWTEMLIVLVRNYTPVQHIKDQPCNATTFVPLVGVPHPTLLRASSSSLM